MNRRTFLVTFSAALFAFSALGCNTTTVAAFVVAIGRYGSELAALLGTDYGPQITSLSAQLAAAIKNWQSGSAATVAIEIGNELLDVLNEIATTVGISSTDLAVIDLLGGAITGLLMLLPASATAAVRQTHIAKLRAAGVASRNYAPAHYADLSKQTMTKAKNDLADAIHGLMPQLK